MFAFPRVSHSTNFLFQSIERPSDSGERVKRARFIPPTSFDDDELAHRAFSTHRKQSACVATDFFLCRSIAVYVKANAILVVLELYP